MKKILVVFLALYVVNAVVAEPKAEKEKGKTRKVSVVSDIVDAYEMYVYGVAFSPIDSVVYMTDEQKLDGAQIHLRSKFLVARNELSNQLRNQMLLEGEKNFSCCVVYSPKIKDLDKKYLKQAAFYKKRGFKVMHISQDRFVFKAVRTEYNDEGYATEEVEVPVSEEE